MKKIQNTKDAFILKIQSLYDIEKQLEKALPKMAKAANDENLKNGFLSHFEETKNHSVRLEKIFEMLGEDPKKDKGTLGSKTKCEGIRGIIEDGDSVAKLSGPKELQDAIIASAARYAEHYEMAGYLSAIKMSDQLGMIEVTDILNETLKEEEVADEKLAQALEDNFAKSPAA